jgi:phosphoribosylanthranilate isomerase
VVAGTPRGLDIERAAALARLARSHPGPPKVVLVTADAKEYELRRFVDEIGPDIVQLSGHEALAILDALARPAWKVLRGSGRPGRDDRRGPRLALHRPLRADRARRAPPELLGGTGQQVDRSLAAAVARDVPLMLAGGLRPANVAQAVLDVPALGVDVSSGVEVGSTIPPRKDPLAVALFVKRAQAARFDRPHTASRPQPVPIAGLLAADERGRWGPSTATSADATCPRR